MVYRVPSLRVGEVGRDILPWHSIPVFVHHEHVERAVTPARVVALVFER